MKISFNIKVLVFILLTNFCYTQNYWKIVSNRLLPLQPAYGINLRQGIYNTSGLVLGWSTQSDSGCLRYGNGMVQYWQGSTWLTVATTSGGIAAGDADSLGGLPASSYLLKADSTIVTSTLGNTVTYSGHTADVKTDTTLIPFKNATSVWTASQYHTARDYFTSESVDTILAKSTGNIIYVIDTLKNKAVIVVDNINGLTIGNKPLQQRLQWNPGANSYFSFNDSSNARADLQIGELQSATTGNFSDTLRVTGDITIGAGNAAGIIIDGADYTARSGTNQIGENGGNIQYSSRASHQIIMDNDANGVGSFTIYADGSTSNPMFQVFESGEASIKFKANNLNINALSIERYGSTTDILTLDTLGTVDGNNYLADTSSFSGTTARKAIYIQGVTGKDKYNITWRVVEGDETNVPTGIPYYQAKTDSLIVFSSGAIISNQKLSYMRIK